MSITLQGDFSYNHQQVLKQVVNQLQKYYDINPKIIQDWLKTAKFKEMLEEKDEKCYQEIMDREYPILNKLLEVSHPESFVEEYMPWEREKCGQIIEEFSNGYVKYCNNHRYLHQTKEKDNDVDHYFVGKTPKEVLEEKIFNLKFNLYVDYTRYLAKTLVDEFVKYLERSSYQPYFVAESDFNMLLDWMKKHPKDFREKTPTYQGTTVYVRAYFKKQKEIPQFELLDNSPK